MSDADVAEILKLPAEERLRLVELIWESLSTTPDAVPLSDAHRVAIDEELVGANLLKIPILGNTGCNFLKENYAPPGSLSETVAVVGALYWRCRTDDAFIRAAVLDQYGDRAPRPSHNG